MDARPSPSEAIAAPRPPSEASWCSSMWSNILPELAGLILGRFPSIADRVRFGSVCHHWRHAAQQQAPLLPPPFPWTITFCTGTVQTIPDGEVHHLFSGGKLAQIKCSSESWLLIVGTESPDESKIQNFLKNPLSGATLQLPALGNPLYAARGGLCGVTKFIMCPDNLIVAKIRSDPLILFCRPGKSSWSTSSQAAARDRLRYEDIAFNNGSVYAITERGDLFAHEVSEDLGHRVISSSVKLVIKGG